MLSTSGVKWPHLRGATSCFSAGAESRNLAALVKNQFGHLSSSSAQAAGRFACNRFIGANTIQLVTCPMSPAKVCLSHAC